MGLNFRNDIWGSWSFSGLDKESERTIGLSCDDVWGSWSFSSLDNDFLDKESKDSFDQELGGAVDELPMPTFTAIIQDFETDIGGLWGCESEKHNGDQKSFSGLNLVRFQQLKGNLQFDKISIPISSFSQIEIGNGVSYGDNSGCSGNVNVNDGVVCNNEAKEVCFDCGGGGIPHDALFFALGCLGVKDLLSVERVCRSLRDAVRSDPLLWRSIHIYQPLSSKISDDALVKLTGRAVGTLQCLSLVNCCRITDIGLKRVLESNPGLKKLCVPDCLKLSIEGILSNLRAFMSSGTPGIKHLRIGRQMGITDKQFEEFKCLLGEDDNMQLRTRKPQFFGFGHLYPPCDDDRAFDIESCPKCQKLGLVYDCPRESCRAKDHASQVCRGCTLCIARCFYCGCCLEDCEYEETFCLDMLCVDCLKKLVEKSEVCFLF
ncbi:F-box protein SKIP14-like [Pistacia vera]|uniref:F-box protein SKIP14-like n=1 Tax=Pistacia vera TaxID=55513 RepID=UPI0012630670|nr:F-box protein SKIP14-like [Pistacia vera]